MKLQDLLAHEAAVAVCRALAMGCDPREIQAEIEAEIVRTTGGVDLYAEQRLIAERARPSA
jgi:hypothetical protein